VDQERAAAVRPRISRWAAGCAVALSLLAGGCDRGSSPGGSATTTGADSSKRGSDAKGDYVVGMILVGPNSDKGWNQGHFDGIKAAISRLPGVRLEYVDKVNPSDRPNVKGSQVADDLISRGAKLVVFNSDDFKDDALDTAKKHPEVTVIHASGDYAWKEGRNFKNQPNLGNLMAQMESGKMIAGCAAALTSQTGKVGYLGPLINDETRRLVASAYMGARHCWETYRKRKPEELTFKVTWIGFWFNIPGVTLDPTKVADDFFNGGFDVLMSGIDTPEAAVQGKKAHEAGKKAWYVHYDHRAGCEISPENCIGVPYFNWITAYQELIPRVRDGKYQAEFVWSPPDYSDLGGEKTTVGYVSGKAIGEQKAQLDDFIKALAGGLKLFKGPLKYQDGSEFLKEGETATPQQIWYLPQLPEGMTGASK
jgi:simple sugar transport system substrate-binding protein